MSIKAHTRKKLESLLGHLSQAATVVQPGQTFLRKLCALLQESKVPHHFVRLSEGQKPTRLGGSASFTVEMVHQ